MTNIYIMSLPRSGSTYLYKIMSQSPDITQLYYEPFNYDDVLHVSNKTEIYNRCAAAIADIKQHNTGVLIKDTLTYVQDIKHNQDYYQLFSKFQTYINEHFYRIKLYRRNIFEQAISNCVASLTGTWSRKTDDFKFQVVNIELRHFKSVLDINKQRTQFLVNYPHYDKIIYYEDIINNYNLDTEWVFDFLKPPDRIEPAVIMRNPPKHKVVYNYSELLNWYESNRHEYEIDYDN